MFNYSIILHSFVGKIITEPGNWVLGAVYWVEPRTENREPRTQNQEPKCEYVNQIVPTADGSHTIFVPELNEHYHSIHGAVQESTFIFINNGFNISKADPLNIFEIGFGTGLNALLTVIKSSAGLREVNYTTIEKYPLSVEMINSLNHYQFAGDDGKAIFNLLHSSPWSTIVKITGNFNLKKINVDISDLNLTDTFDLIYFDAFGPDKQPEMWTKDVFTRIAAITNRTGILVTYSVKGEVKRNLKACGFEVTILPGPPGKRQILRAVKI